MSPRDAIEKLHAGISRRDLWRLIWKTGGTVERIYRTGEYRIRYSHLPAPSGALNARRKDVARDAVLYTRNALLTSPAPDASRFEEPEPQELKSDFAEGLKRLREARGLSHRELADQTGLTRELIGSWERDEADPTDEQLAQLAKSLPSIAQYIEVGPAPTPAPEPANREEPVAAVAPLPPPAALPPPPPETFAEALKRERETAGLSQRELNLMLTGSDSRSVVNNWENGSCGPTRENYEKLLELLPALKGAPQPLLRYEKLDKKKEAQTSGSTPAQLGAQYGCALAEYALAKKMVAEASAALEAAVGVEREAKNRVDAAHKALLEGAMA